MSERMSERLMANPDAGGLAGPIELFIRLIEWLDPRWFLSELHPRCCFAQSLKHQPGQKKV